MKKIFTLTALGLLSSSVYASAPKNIIYMIGDGMGPAYTTAYRYYSDDLTTKDVETTVFDSILTGMARTFPDDHTYVTDSAAGATALSTGHKSYNGAIAVDTAKKPLETMLEIAKKRGMLTALVATSQINHATPASFAAHNVHRKNYNEIANDYIDNKINGRLPVDLLLGGGTDYFKRNDRDLVAEFIQSGYQYSDDLSSINSITSIPALGLFAKIGMDFAIDSTPDRLTQMTNKALSLLEKQNKDGFFVMIEGSQIDWCGHANDIRCAMGEMDDFAHSIQAAKNYVDKHPDTLLVITADHSTGGLTLGANGEYKWDTEVIKGVKVTAERLAKKILKHQDINATWQKYVSWPIDKTQLQALSQAKEQGKDALFDAVKAIINSKSYTGWTTGGHTAIDVQVFAYGQGSEAFRGHLNNTDIAAKMIEYIKQ
ncbi:alkaline phosphatase [Pseudoalteromonas tunicata]|jgi:alkaline phosphatase|uniref:Putative alkaline phosphatase n=1 Tax=Pseudoalteromonas tunicata D2 TaxID=87626 RepID=A4C467_9GAMM|nr:alkaline phosphatase [Pseudoalteromonas tunicata]ATC97170.1 alkaline phosphatase [Pseudoalteromonas tunicata]AXT33273.1 alkaline phosphatase [Pseudoalteromonas tunicata]EAR30349.1 putative alkaline phosphatase [Pseudoalteromonas tunicata D2]MDP4984748.1 alkaline phosphatase [Pseudoalteromonas tunicata]MDP5214206.1 alkaline phosphatase [Pseudoalteromonas tunicata]